MRCARPPSARCPESRPTHQSATPYFARRSARMRACASRRARLRPDTRRRPRAGQLGLGTRRSRSRIEPALGRRGLDPRVVALVGDPDARLAPAASAVGGAQDDHLVALQRVQRDAAEDGEAEDRGGGGTQRTRTAIHLPPASAIRPARPCFRSSAEGGPGQGRHSRPCPERAGDQPATHRCRTGPAPGHRGGGEPANKDG